MIAGVFDEVFGVPTHPLAVHAPVVLIPLLAIASIVVLFHSSWRERTTIPFAALALIMVALLFVARESGQTLEESGNVLGDVERHMELADQTFILSIVWSVFAAAGAAVVLFGGRNRSRSLSAATASIDTGRIVVVLNILAAAAVVVTTVWLVMTGHSGAESRWVG